MYGLFNFVIMLDEEDFMRYVHQVIKKVHAQQVKTFLPSDQIMETIITTADLLPNFTNQIPVLDRSIV